MILLSILDGNIDTFVGEKIERAIEWAKQLREIWRDIGEVFGCSKQNRGY